MIIPTGNNYENFYKSYEMDIKNDNVEEIEKDIECFPFEIKSLIISFLDEICDVNSCLKISKDWNQVVEKNWKKIGEIFDNFYQKDLNNKLQIKDFIKRKKCY